MKKQELIKRLEDYLMKSKTVFIENSIRYIGIRENYIISNEESRDYYLLGFDVIADKKISIVHSHTLCT